MTSMLRKPYPKSPGYGAWGPVTSNHNFCEEDYVITRYIGEFVNTLTNVNYVIYGLFGLRRVRSHKEGGLFSSLAFPYWGLIGVGVLSAWFHATLKYHSQMGDDLSMFLAAGALLQQVYSVDKPKAYRLKVTATILGALIPISIYHCWADEIYVHELVFAAMVVLVTLKVQELLGERVKNREVRKKIANLSFFGLGCGLFGYFLWNIDYHLCSYVTAVKHGIGLPFGMLLELHGWWHICTGIGAYVGMAISEYIITANDGDADPSEGFVWPVRRVFQNLEHGKKTE